MFQLYPAGGVATGRRTVMQNKPLVILLVEDDQAHAEIVRRNLGNFHVDNQLKHVRDGEAALDYLNGRGSWRSSPHPRPDVILLDLRLPKIDGLDLLKIIKADSELRLIPVVVLTTSSAEQDINRAYSCHANSYLVKPLDLEQFVNMIGTFGNYWLDWNRRPA